MLTYGLVAQPVEQRPFKAKVAGSNPAWPTIFERAVSENLFSLIFLCFLQLMNTYDKLFVILFILLYSYFIMAEVFWNHDRYIENIDVKWDQVTDWFNEKQIREKARNYVKNRISEWISPEDYQKLLQEIKTILERQDIERLNLTEELEWEIIQKTREELDKEALIQQAKTILYEKLWLHKNLNQNSKTENFLKWIVDVLVIDNYDLAI